MRLLGVGLGLVWALLSAACAHRSAREVCMQKAEEMPERYRQSTYEKCLDMYTQPPPTQVNVYR